MENDATAFAVETSGDGPNPGEAKSEADSADFPPARPPVDPDLAAVVDAWPALPAATRSAIVAMIGAAK